MNNKDVVLGGIYKCNGLLGICVPTSINGDSTTLKFYYYFNGTHYHEGTHIRPITVLLNGYTYVPKSKAGLLYTLSEKSYNSVKYGK